MSNADWRLFRCQDKYLMGATLIKQAYKPSSESNDHDHCEFCMDKFGSDSENLHFGYCTEDEKIWICDNCFNDFKNRFHWKIQ
mgnify:CR=1 FL=1